MDSRAANIDEVVKTYRELFVFLYGKNFESSSFEDLLQHACTVSRGLIESLYSEVINKDDTHFFRTSEINSKFAIAFIVAAPVFVNFTLFIKSKRSKTIGLEFAEFIAGNLDFYRKMAYPKQSCRYLTYVPVNMWDDKAETIKHLSWLIDKTRESLVGRGHSEGLLAIFSFSSSKPKPLKCYRQWIEAYACYVYKMSAVPLTERIEALVFSGKFNDDKKGTEFNRRNLAESLIKKALSREPMSSAHT